MIVVEVVPVAAVAVVVVVVVAVVAAAVVVAAVVAVVAAANAVVLRGLARLRGHGALFYPQPNSEFCKLVGGQTSANFALLGEKHPII